MTEKLFSMKVVCRRTGLSPHVVRVWERRYQAVTPERTGTNRRLYSENEIQRLRILHSLTRAGHSIGQIASLPTPELESLFKEEEDKVVVYRDREAAPAGPAVPAADPAAEMVRDALEAARSLHTRHLESVFDRAAVRLGYSGLIERVIAPLIHQIGEAWAAGALSAAHEHAASALIKDYLARSAASYAEPAGPGMIITSPSGQLHELGAVLCAALARKAGWRVTYLGPSLPAEEIAGAAISNEVRAVALSIVYPPDDPALPGQLRRLRQLLPQEISILAGGRAAPHYEETLRHIGAILLTDLPSFKDALTQLRADRKAR